MVYRQKRGKEESNVIIKRYFFSFEISKTHCSIRIIPIFPFNLLDSISKKITIIVISVNIFGFLINIFVMVSVVDQSKNQVYNASDGIWNDKRCSPSIRSLGKESFFKLIYENLYYKSTRFTILINSFLGIMSANSMSMWQAAGTDTTITRGNVGYSKSYDVGWIWSSTKMSSPPSQSSTKDGFSSFFFFTEFLRG